MRRGQGRDILNMSIVGMSEEWDEWELGGRDGCLYMYNIECKCFGFHWQLKKIIVHSIGNLFSFMPMTFSFHLHILISIRGTGSFCGGVGDIGSNGGLRRGVGSIVSFCGGVGSGCRGIDGFC